MYAILTTDSFTAMLHLSPLVQHRGSTPAEAMYHHKARNLEGEGHDASCNSLQLYELYREMRVYVII